MVNGVKRESKPNRFGRKLRVPNLRIPKTMAIFIYSYNQKDVLFFFFFSFYSFRIIYMILEKKIHRENF